MIYKTKRIRRALALIADQLDQQMSSNSFLYDDPNVPEIDVRDTIDWLFEQAEDPKPKAVDVLLREMGAPELFHMEEK